MKKIVVILLLLAGIPAAAQLNKEQQVIKNTFFSFLKFYQKNESRFNSFLLYKGTGQNSNPPYHIVWKEAEKYFAYLRSSVPMVGEAYIRAERNHFKYYDSCFKADPEDELPAGFDYDRWAGGQEDIEYTMQYYMSKDNNFQVTITGNKAVLRIGGALPEGQEERDRNWSFVPFVKEKGKWKMADNVLPEMDDENP